MNRNTLSIGLCLMVALALAACTNEITPQVTTPVEAQAIVTPTSELPTESVPAQQSPTPGQIDFGIPTRPLIPGDTKPPLYISGDQEQEQFTGAANVVSQVIGFTFPDGIIAIKAAPYEAPYNPDSKEELTQVGRVEIGEGGTNPGTYEVKMDLDSQNQCVLGELIDLESGDSNTLSIRFVRIPQVPNPERVEKSETVWPPIIDEGLPTDNRAVITADAVCFVLKSGESYYRYCSEPGSDLSAMKNELRYSELVALIGKTAEIFGLQNDIVYTQTISTLEDSGHIYDCFEEQAPGGRGGISNGETACDSDIILAPVTKEYLARTLGSAADLPAFQSLITSSTTEQNPCKPTPTPTPEPEKKACKSPYVVHYSEWVWKIGRRCNISPYAIIDANGLVPPYWLYPGDVLILPRNAPPFPGRPQSSLPTSQFAFSWGSLPLSRAMVSIAWQDTPTTIPISVTVGVVKVLREIDTDSQYSYSDNKDIVRPGDYRLDYWFDDSDNFIAATISGFSYVDEVEYQVINQKIPAVPAAFVNADGTEPVSAQISACRIFRHCFFNQRGCS